MKVLHTISSIGKFSGGPALSTVLTVQGERNLGIDARILSYATYLKGDSSMITESFVYLITPPREKTFKYSRLFYNELNRHHADLIHIQGIWQYPSFCGALHARSNRKPYIITLRGMLYPQCFEKSALIKQLSLKLYLKSDLQHASCLHATCIEEMEHLRAMGISAPVAVIPNPISIEGIDHVSISSEKKRIGYLGRVHPRKRIERLLYVSDKLRDLNFELVIIGDGDFTYMQYLKEEVDRLKLENIVFTGFLSGEDKECALGSLSYLVVPSDFENFGNIVTESLVKGIPVIASKGTPWEDLNTFKCGWWVDNDIETLTEVVREALNIPEVERLAMGERGRLLIKEKFAVKIVATQMKQLYEWILYAGEKPEFVYLK